MKRTIWLSILKKHFDDVTEVNFERQPEFKLSFENRRPNEIIEKLDATLFLSKRSYKLMRG